MRRTLPFVALWLAAGTLAVVVASAGVAVVDDHLTASRPAPLSAEEVHARLEEAATSTTAPDGTTSTTAVATTTTTAPPVTTGGTDGPGTGGPTVPTTAPAPAAVTRTYELIGGTTTIRFSSSGITVLTSTPKPGFTAEVEPEGSGVKVEFESESESHRSRIDAWWAGGPQTRIREEADS